MGDLKPLGSEKLKGDDKMKRILELTFYNTNKNDDKIDKPEFVCESVNGFFGITKEKDGYYVKKGLTESTLDYIGGLYMKNKNRFKSYAEAFKRLEYLKGQEILNEEKKYILKVNKNKPSEDLGGGGMTPSLPPESSSPGEVPPMDGEEAPPEDMGALTPDAGMEGGEVPPDTEDGGEEPDIPDGDEESSDGGGDPLKGIQKLTGRLAEKIRSHTEDMKSEDIKSVLNSIISALDLNDLDDEDKDDVLSSFDNESDDEGTEDGEEGSEDSGDFMPDQSIGAQDQETGNTPDMTGDESELGEVVVDELEELTNTPFDFEDDGGERCSWCGYANGHAHGCPNGGEDNSEFSESSGFDEEVEMSEDGGFSREYIDTMKSTDGFDDLENDSFIDWDETGDTENMPEESSDEEIQSKEIELDELNNMINQSVKETLSKYFE